MGGVVGVLLRNCGEVRILTDFYPVPCIDWFLYPVLYMYNNFNWFLSCHIHWFYFYPVTYIDFIFILSHTVILFLSCHIHWFYFYPVTYSDFVFILSHTVILFLNYPIHVQYLYILIFIFYFLIGFNTKILICIHL
jgi:hypothetical protein